MAISAKDVMALRARTGVGMMECKKALAEADGDSAKAIEILREKLKGKMDERTDRPAGEGALAIAKGDGAIAFIELKAESDFTARNDAFVDAAQKIADSVLAGPDGESTTPTAEATELIDNLRITTKENISFARGHKAEFQRRPCTFGVSHFVQVDIVVCGLIAVRLGRDHKKGCVIRGGNLDRVGLTGGTFHERTLFLDCRARLVRIE